MSHGHNVAASTLDSKCTQDHSKGRDVEYMRGRLGVAVGKVPLIFSGRIHPLRHPFLRELSLHLIDENCEN